MPDRISRAEGYRRAAGKGELGVELAQRFFREVVACSLEEIAGAENNYRSGDLRNPATGASIEVKAQPIRPSSVVSERPYQANFVEVFEITQNPCHSGGLQVVAEAMRISVDDLAYKRVRNGRTGQVEPLGRPDRISFSLTPVQGSMLTVYTNIELRIVCVYRSSELLDAVRAVLLDKASVLVQGAGNSNDVTLAVFVPYSDNIWKLDQDDCWHYHRKDTAAEARSRALVDSVGTSRERP